VYNISLYMILLFFRFEIM